MCLILFPLTILTLFVLGWIPFWTVTVFMLLAPAWYSDAISKKNWYYSASSLLSYIVSKWRQNHSVDLACGPSMYCFSFISFLDRIWQWLWYLWALPVYQNCGTLHYWINTIRHQYQSCLVQFIILFQTDWLHGLFLEENVMKILTMTF